MIKHFRDLPLARKILLIPVLTLFLLGVVLAVAVNNARSNTATLKSLDHDAFAPLHRALILKDRLTLTHGRLFALLSRRATENDPTGWKGEADTIVQSLIQQSLALTALTHDFREEIPDELLNKLTRAHNAWFAAARDTIEAASRDADHGALVMLNADVRFGGLRSILDRLVDDLIEGWTTRTESAISHARLAESVMIGLGAIAATLALAGSIAVGRGIARPVARLTVVIKRIADGETELLASDTDRRDEVGEIARAAEVFRRNAIAQRTADDALSRTHRQLDVALNNMSHGLCLFDGEGRLQLCNRRFHEVTGIPSDSIWPGLPYRGLIAAASAAGILPEDAIEQTHELLIAALTAGTPSRLDTGMPNGRSVTIWRQPLPEGGWVATYEDTTEKRRSEERIVYLAHHDPLTTLPNRRVFRDRLDQALARAARGERFAVLCLDLDHFKNVNDTLGHDVGDELLRRVAERLQDCVREIDLVARLGGDEFAILQENIEHADSASILAARIIEVLGRAFEISGHQVAIGTSIGIAVAPDHGAAGDTLLKNADVALYLAKKEKGRFYFFEPGMEENLRQRRFMEMELRRGLERGEFELHYQPLLTLDGDRVVALETLVRWRHPERGMIGPDEFIPLAEDTGLIVPLGKWILTAACREATTWPDDVKVAVNLSPIQFKGNGLYEEVGEALCDSHLPPGRLDLEITESVLMKNNEQTLATLHRIRALGVRISMDDFGTGYSSLSYLNRFPFDKIKIDRSFVADITRKKGAVEIVRAIIALGRGLGMTTVAEGVETDAQLRQLRLEGCTEVQGFLFSPPVPASEVPALLARLNGLAEVPALLAGVNSMAKAWPDQVPSPRASTVCAI